MIGIELRPGVEYDNGVYAKFSWKTFKKDRGTGKSIHVEFECEEGIFTECVIETINLVDSYDLMHGFDHYCARNDIPRPSVFNLSNYLNS